MEKYEQIISIIESKLYPISLNERGKTKIRELSRQFDYDLIIESIDAGFLNYIKFKDGKPTKESCEIFLNKLGGIARNKSLSPIDKQIQFLINTANKRFEYFDKQKAQGILTKYVAALKHANWGEKEIVKDLSNDMLGLLYRSTSWTNWKNKINDWIEDVYNWDNEISIANSGSILPCELFKGTKDCVEKICAQINASYEHNLFDCCSVMMRRLIEVLLIMTYRNFGVENDIKQKDSFVLLSLDKIIKDAEKNSNIELSAETRKNLSIFKDLGNLSAHRVWYNCLKKDLDEHKLKFRTVVEELLYSAGLKN